MKKELSLNPEMQEITENDLQEINGGYGYWEGHNQGSAAAASLFWSGVTTFVNGIKTGINNALDHCAC